MPVDFDFLTKDHVHTKGELVWVVRDVGWSGGAKIPCNCLDQMFDVLLPVVLQVDRHMKIVSQCEMKAFDDCLSSGDLTVVGFDLIS